MRILALLIKSSCQLPVKMLWAQLGIGDDSAHHICRYQWGAKPGNV